MEQKIATARAEVEAGITKKERDIKAAYEAVKLSISKIDDHHFQYNVRSLLEDAKAEADRRCAHEDHDTNEIIDDIENWVWDFVEESIDRFNGKVTAERAALAEGLNNAADRVWEESQEHGEILAQHQEHEKTALEFYLKDCVKALKHLFNRYGYVSPAFEAVEHQHGYGQPHSHVAGEVDAQKLVHTLGPNGDDDHTKPPKGYEAAKPTGDLEERSSCTGSSCENPLEVDHDHKEIQLDSLEDLANVIDDEIIHRTADHEHVPSKPQKVREYEPFIVQEEAPGTAVDVPAVHAPTKEELAKKVLEERETTTYEAIALPSFAPVSYKAAAEEEKPHYVRPEAIDEIVNAPEPVPVPEPTNVIGKGDDDIWGGYLATYSQPKATSTYADTVKPAGGAWSPAPLPTFDVSRYLLKGRETKTSTGTSYGAEGWWSAQPAKQSQNWWDAWTADMPEDSTTNPEETYEAPAPARRTYKPYVPRSTYSKPFTPAVKWQSAPSQGNWWEK